MAALVQQKNGRSTATTSLAVTLTSTPVNGNCLVAYVSTTVGDPTGISGGGVTWAKKKSSGAGGNVGVFSIWVGLNVTNAASGVITISLASDEILAIIAEFSGVNTASADDGTGGSAHGSSTTPSASMTTTVASDVLLFGSCYDTADNYSSGPSAGVRLTPPADSTTLGTECGYQFLSAAGSQGPSFTITPAGLWDAAIWALQQQPTGGLPIFRMTNQAIKRAATW